MMISGAVMDCLATAWRVANSSIDVANLAGDQAARLRARIALDGYFDLVERVLEDVNKRLEDGVADR